jgi:hypothetical protein
MRRGSIPTFIHISDGKCTTSMCWTCCLSRPAPSTSWIEVTWTSSGSTRSIKREASSSCAPSEISMHGACTRRRWTATQDSSEPDHCSQRLLCSRALPRLPASHPLSRSRDRQEPGVPDQPVCVAGADHLHPVPVPMAGGAPYRKSSYLCNSFHLWRQVGQTPLFKALRQPGPCRHAAGLICSSPVKRSIAAARGVAPPSASSTSGIDP